MLKDYAGKHIYSPVAQYRALEAFKSAFFDVGEKMDYYREYLENEKLHIHNSSDIYENVFFRCFSHTRRANS